MHLLTSIIESGMPWFRHELPAPLRAFHQFHSFIDGIIVYKDYIVIPLSLHQDILSTLHSEHQCVSFMMARAESSMSWPGITPAITAVLANCKHCIRIAHSQPSAPPTPPMLPLYPFQCVCSDLFTYKGINYLVTVDRYSNWPIIDRTMGGAKDFIESLYHSFVTYWILDE